MPKEKKVLLLGGVILDRYYEVARYPHAGQDAIIDRAYDKVGGCCLNVAITLNNLGIAPHIVSRLGDDEIGRQILAYINGIPLPSDCLTVQTGASTGYCLTILDASGERTFLTYAGIEKTFASEAIAPAMQGAPDFVYVTGYYLLRQDTAARVLHSLRQMQQTGCPILFDPGPLVGEIAPQQLEEMIRLASVMTPNQHEMQTIQARLGLVGDAIASLLQMSVQQLVLKNGAQGSIVYTKDGQINVPSLPVSALDSTGAGDSFAGGLIASLLQGKGIADAVGFASACGAYTATVAGPHAFFTQPEIIKFINEHKEVSP